MKLRLPILLSLAGLLVAVGAIAVACGGGGSDGDGASDGGLTLEEYFQQFDAVNKDIGTRISAVEAEYPQAFVEAAATRDALSEIDAIITDGLARLDDIDPPAEVREAHNEFRDGAAAEGQLLRELVANLAGVESASELAQVLDPSGPELEATVARLGAACVALSAIAADNDIAIDLKCRQQ
jgi:hypothetical protein